MDTEMTLTNEDIRRIRDLGHEDFYFENDGYYQLKNVDGHCIFLKKGRCSIYSSRPEGCLHYPLMLNLDNDRVIVHDFCPHIEGFEMTDKDRKTLKALVHRELREREKRLQKKGNCANR